MRLASPLFFGSFTALSFALAAACSGGTFSDGDDPLDATVDGDRDASTSPDATVAPDAASQNDAAVDATTPPDDAGSETDAAAELDADIEVDAGPVQPGSACETVGQEFTQRCGTCGIQKAFCTAELVVGGYGSCVERHPAECASDAGTDAGSDAGADAGEGDAAVDAGPEDAGEPDAGEPDAGEPPVDTWVGYSIDVDFAVGASGVVAMPEKTSRRPRISVAARRACPVPFPGTSILTDFAWVRVRNPASQAAKVELNVLRGTGPTDTILATYPAPAETDDAFKSCIGYADRGTCDDPGNPQNDLSCLTGVAAVSIPARSEVYAYVAMAADNIAWRAPGLSVKLISRP